MEGCPRTSRRCRPGCGRGRTVVGAAPVGGRRAWWYARKEVCFGRPGTVMRSPIAPPLVMQPPAFPGRSRPPTRPELHAREERSAAVGPPRQVPLPWLRSDSGPSAHQSAAPYSVPSSTEWAGGCADLWLRRIRHQPAPHQQVLRAQQWSPPAESRVQHQWLHHAVCHNDAGRRAPASAVSVARQPPALHELHPSSLGRQLVGDLAATSSARRAAHEAQRDLVRLLGVSAVVPEPHSFAARSERSPAPSVRCPGACRRPRWPWSSRCSSQGAIVKHGRAPIGAISAKPPPPVPPSLGESAIGGSETASWLRAL